MQTAIRKLFSYVNRAETALGRAVVDYESHLFTFGDALEAWTTMMAFQQADHAPLDELVQDYMVKHFGDRELDDLEKRQVRDDFLCEVRPFLKRCETSDGRLSETDIAAGVCAAGAVLQWGKCGWANPARTAVCHRVQAIDGEFAAIVAHALQQAGHEPGASILVPRIEVLDRRLRALADACLRAPRGQVPMEVRRELQKALRELQPFAPRDGASTPDKVGPDVPKERRRRPKKPPNWDRLGLRERNEGDVAVLDGKEYALPQNGLTFLSTLKDEKGLPVSSTSFGSYVRPDRVLNKLHSRLRRIILPPDKKGARNGYRMKP